MADSGGSPAANFFERLKAYVRTRKGTILTAEILISFIILICYAASLYSGYTSVAICEMIFAIIFLVVFTMELDKQFQIISWPWSDLIRAVIGALLYLITSIICLIGGGGDGPRIAGGVFGLLAGVLFGYDSYTIYMQIKGGAGHTAAPTDEGV